MEVQQRPDVGRTTTQLIESVSDWVETQSMLVLLLAAGCLPLAAIGQMGQTIPLLRRGGGSISSPRWSYFHRGDAGACQPCLSFGGDLMICNICVNIFGGSWGGGGGGGPLFSLWRGGEGVQLSARWTWVQMIQNAPPPPPKKTQNKTQTNVEPE